jgi:hypothetical protein
MPAHIAAGPVHHLRLTVTGIQRSRRFCTGLLGLQVAAGIAAARRPVRGDLLMGLRPMAPIPDRR